MFSSNEREEEVSDRSESERPGVSDMGAAGNLRSLGESFPRIPMSLRSRSNPGSGRSGSEEERDLRSPSEESDRS